MNQRLMLSSGDSFFGFLSRCCCCSQARTITTTGRGKKKYKMPALLLLFIKKQRSLTLVLATITCIINMMIKTELNLHDL